MSAAARIWEIDPWLTPYKSDLELRRRQYRRVLAALLSDGQKSLAEYANGYLYFGFHREADGWVYREWAPGARALFLFGDFNGWDRRRHPLTYLGGGNWELRLPGPLPHGSKARLLVVTGQETLERLPLYSRRVTQQSGSPAFDAQIWQPETPFPWTDGGFRPANSPLFIYECHVGMSGEEPRVATYAEFADRVLPRARRLGYNAVQLMAVMEHPYYASFGYQVTNFFAPSSRFGAPEDLKNLIDTAHSLGLAVLLDLVHSHAAPNEVEGLARFDGTGWQFFHKGPAGVHPQWGTKLFNYAKPEVLHFLLSNLKYWLDEFHFDGFRFDGVTSMLYHDHGLGVNFDHYRKYFSLNTDTDAVTYLQLAATLCKEVKPSCILIAEDMSGMPGMCLPAENDGIGFDYRLGMGLPDFWIRALAERSDEDWDIGALWREQTQRRPREKVVAYCESHDQALVGDKTLMFRMADREMYTHMHKNSDSQVIERAMALHKMIRFITCVCGDAYLNFMGNEFGHPEWIDFPRAGNGDSYHYARRQWSLAENSDLRYHELENFDKSMLALAARERLTEEAPVLLVLDETAKTLVFTKKNLLFVFNFHPSLDASLSVKLPPASPAGGEWIESLHTNERPFGGRHDSYPPFPAQGRLLTLNIDRRSAAALRHRSG
ncbi:MAG: alpha amylase C-terminal domain-containing protein [Gracilibacteraceae bacterium]|nr:alpha amylase C-terminal domain-containing protein [Gracilibacteraceae bacterium]